MNQRIQQNIKRDLPSQEYSDFMSKRTGEYIDGFTVVPDNRTAEEVLSREPKCVVAHRQKKKAENAKRNKKADQDKANTV